MYFSSTMPVGRGGADLYYATFEAGRWSEPVNVGDAVNTWGDETFPFIANDTTLYFSSTGHGGLGGMDVYVSYRRNGVFIKPMNLGRPMNSGFDDFSLVIDSLGRSGYVSSNAEGDGRHDQIFHFVAKYYFLMGEVHELNAGTKRIPGVKISAFNSNGDLIDSARSDQQGYFTLDLPFDQDFNIRGEKPGFETLSDVPFSTRGKPFGVDSLALPMWRKNLFSKGRVFSNETQSILPDAGVILRNVTDNTTDSLLVDQNGEYRFQVKPGKKYRIEATKEGYIANGFNLNTQGLLDGELLNDIVLEEIYMDKEVILFDYNKGDIKPAGAAQLNELVRTLRRFPKATINVAAHADSRGTHEYNMRLSKRRAESARDYLLSMGINKSRIHLSWFGEELVLNRCSDGVECPEEEHSKNRRAELKVQKEPID
jgi:outer membrane protein OmpA-like peptidoglycan-associated protein